MLVKELDQIVVVHLMFNIWSAKKKLYKGDVGLDVNEKLVKLGTKTVTDSDYLLPFNKLRKRADRLCCAVGFKFMGGYAVPQNDADKLAKELEAIVDEFYLEKAKYLGIHKDIQEQFIAEYGDELPVLKEHMVDTAQVEGKINACFCIYKLGKSGVSCDGMERQVEDLPDVVDQDIHSIANSILDKFSSGGYTTMASVNLMAQLKNKIHGISFLDSKYQTLYHQIGAMLRMVQQGKKVKSRLSKHDSEKIKAFMGMLSTPQRMKNFIDRINGVDEVDESESKSEVEVKAKDQNVEHAVIDLDHECFICDPLGESSDIDFDSFDFEDLPI